MEADQGATPYTISEEELQYLVNATSGQGDETQMAFLNDQGELVYPNVNGPSTSKHKPSGLPFNIDSSDDDDYDQDISERSGLSVQGCGDARTTLGEVDLTSQEKSMDNASKGGQCFQGW